MNANRQIASLTVSAMDIEHLGIIRANVITFMTKAAALYAGTAGRLLDIAPQEHEGAAPFFPPTMMIDTLDINPQSNCTYIADICERNAHLAVDLFDYVVCTEVLEHTLQPFDALKEIRRILKPGGRLFLSTPFNFRIHGPLPDCWRFTEHGLRALLRDFTILELSEVGTPGRSLMPIHYTVVAEKPRWGVRSSYVH
ncbi:MAG: class I SAM-dependent methyltransferase [Limisphaerales bacterium]